MTLNKKIAKRVFVNNQQTPFKSRFCPLPTHTHTIQTQFYFFLSHLAYMHRDQSIKFISGCLPHGAHTHTHTHSNSRVSSLSPRYIII